MLLLRQQSTLKPLTPQTLPTYSNVIDDAVRNTGTSGDGAAVPGGVAVWGASTNRITSYDGQTTAGFTPGASVTFATQSGETVPGYPGVTHALKCTIGAGGGAGTVYSQNILNATAAGSPYAGALLIKGTGSTIGKTALLGLRETGGASGNAYTATASLTLTGSYQLLACAGLLQQSDRTSQNWRIELPAGAVGDVILCTVMQGEEQKINTPVIATSGATASRSAARIQVPASVLSAQQFWWATAVTLPYSSAAIPSGDPKVFDWRTDFANRVTMRLQTATGALIQDGLVASQGENAASPAMTWAVGDTLVLIGYGTPATWGASGKGVGYTVAARTHIPAPTSTTFDIANANGTGQLSGSVRWVMAGRTPPENPAVLNAFGATPPGLGALNPAWGVRFYWDCVTSTAYAAA